MVKEIRSDEVVDPRGGEHNKKTARSLIGTLTAAWEDLDPCMRHAWGAKSGLFSLIGYTCFIRANKPRLKEGVPLILVEAEDNSHVSPFGRIPAPAVLNAAPGDTPGTLRIDCTPAPEGFSTVFYVQAKGEGVRRGPLLRRESREAEIIVEGLHPGAWYNVYALYIEDTETGDPMISASTGTLAIAG